MKGKLGVGAETDLRTRDDRQRQLSTCSCLVWLFGCLASAVLCRRKRKLGGSGRSELQGTREPRGAHQREPGIRFGTTSGIKAGWCVEQVAVVPRLWGLYAGLVWSGLVWSWQRQESRLDSATPFTCSCPSRGQRSKGSRSSGWCQALGWQMALVAFSLGRRGASS
ncbi:hypothetical protein IWX90DRAFT_275565 [Phyllosticta citrichinensis]|uniref:Uncharacterized protein n=1 Tax=Phyllosticta citrichinensis TaxID=1130410 RepID=A0ABR1XN58_9PEZI